MIEQIFSKETNTLIFKLTTLVPNYVPKNILNYRIYSIEYTDGRTVRDPIFLNSRYIFSINKTLLNKKVFFNFRISDSNILDVKKITLGFCDEKFKWLNATLFTFENNFFKTIVLEKNTKNEVEVKSLKEEINISTEIISKQTTDEFVSLEKNIENELLSSSLYSDKLTDGHTDYDIKYAAEISSSKEDEVVAIEISGDHSPAEDDHSEVTVDQDEITENTIESDTIVKTSIAKKNTGKKRGTRKRK